MVEVVRIDDSSNSASWMAAALAHRARPRTEMVTGGSVIGYVTIGTVDERSAVAKIEKACREADWQLIEIVRDRETARALERPGLSYALGQIARGPAGGLIVSDLRQLFRSMCELGTLLEWFREARAVLVALDLQLDTATPLGDELAASLITLSDWERQRITARTQDAMARGKSEGRTSGRPAVSDRPELVKRIADMRHASMTLQAIADQLNAETVPTMRGGKLWRPSSVQAALGYRRPPHQRATVRRSTQSG
jgi:DNA invertase Pin-like site-specific DNA recombinase